MGWVGRKKNGRDRQGWTPGVGGPYPHQVTIICLIFYTDVMNRILKKK